MATRIVFSKKVFIQNNVACSNYNLCREKLERTESWYLGKIIDDFISFGVFLFFRNLYWICIFFIIRKGNAFYTLFLFLVLFLIDCPGRESCQIKASRSLTPIDTVPSAPCFPKSPLPLIQVGPPIPVTGFEIVTMGKAGREDPGVQPEQRLAWDLWVAMGTCKH